MTLQSDLNRQTKSLVQGEYLVSRDPNIEVSTVLGSCIAVCLHDAVASVGGMNHFLLPGKRTDSGVESRFGINLMELLINGMLSQGAERHRLVAKVFGGGALLSSNTNVGAKNAQFAQEFLTNEKINCAATSIGGTRARRVRFHPASGTVKQLLVPAHDATEQFEFLRAPPPVQAPEVTLF